MFLFSLLSDFSYPSRVGLWSHCAIYFHLY